MHRQASKFGTPFSSACVAQGSVVCKGEDVQLKEQCQSPKGPPKGLEAWRHKKGLSLILPLYYYIHGLILGEGVKSWLFSVPVSHVDRYFY